MSEIKKCQLPVYKDGYSMSADTFTEELKVFKYDLPDMIIKTNYIAGWIRAAPWVIRDLFPGEYKAKRWIKRAKKIGKMNSHRFLDGHNRLIEKQLKAKRIWL